MQVEIKREKPVARDEVDVLYKLSFEKEDISSVIRKFRDSELFIPELSRVARINDQIIGSIMLAKGEIVRGRRHTPVIIIVGMAVLPKYQGLGVGEELMRSAFLKARKHQFKAILVFDQDEYFTKFGFTLASDYEITTSIEIGEDEFYALELEEGYLEDARGNLKNQPIYNELLQYYI